MENGKNIYLALTTIFGGEKFKLMGIGTSGAMTMLSIASFAEGAIECILLRKPGESHHRSQIEGLTESDFKIVIVDDMVSEGSTMEAIKEMISDDITYEIEAVAAECASSYHLKELFPNLKHIIE